MFHNISMRTNEQKTDEFRRLLQDIFSLDKKEQNFSSKIKRNKWKIVGGVLAATALGATAGKSLKLVIEKKRENSDSLRLARSSIFGSRIKLD